MCARVRGFEIFYCVWLFVYYYSPPSHARARTTRQLPAVKGAAPSGPAEPSPRRRRRRCSRCKRPTVGIYGRGGGGGGGGGGMAVVGVLVGVVVVAVVVMMVMVAAVVVGGGGGGQAGSAYQRPTRISLFYF